MGATPHEYFVDRFRRATASERRRFVADLWEARGWETTVEDSRIVAHRGTQTERIAVVTGGWFGLGPSVPNDAEVVVALAPLSAPSARVVSVDELFEQVRYGLPVEVGNRLVESHFGATLDDVPPPSATGLPLVGTVTVPSVLVVLAVVALLVLAIVTTAGVPGVDPGFGASPETQSSPAATPEQTATPEPRPIASGVTTAGIENATLLAAAHRDAVSTESYRWTIGYRESIAGDEIGREVEVVRVEEPHVYSSEVQRVSWSGLRAYPRPTSSEDSFADGAMRYARRPNEPDGLAVRVIDPAVLDGPGRQALRAERYVEWYLSTEQSRVVNSTVEDGVTVYRIEGSGNDFPRSRDYEFVALVEESGFVRSMQVSYETRDGLEITVWSEYDSVGSTTVEPPSWVVRGGQTTTAE
ncbi:hypothetical protein GJR99_12420 [Haloferax sp. MBLA0078]|uniref:Uncharacterized protein n=2 Tax=Haloferacaceae TaxID=1644056 RepID=A0A6A8GAT6_9EURY|nr:hypothetical protein Hfx1150_12455 [Haloferax sp. CBA1150]MRW97373.1 hypothetical protein [Haloferax marinum]